MDYPPKLWVPCASVLYLDGTESPEKVYNPDAKQAILLFKEEYEYTPGQLVGPVEFIPYSNALSDKTRTNTWDCAECWLVAFSTRRHERPYSILINSSKDITRNMVRTLQKSIHITRVEIDKDYQAESATARILFFSTLVERELRLVVQELRPSLEMHHYSLEQQLS